MSIFNFFFFSYLITKSILYLRIVILKYIGITVLIVLNLIEIFDFLATLILIK